MTLSTTFSAREFDRNTSRARRLALDAPVFVTTRGTPSHVLLSIEQYRQLSAPKANIVDLLAMPEAADIDFDPPRLGDIFRPTDLS